MHTDKKIRVGILGAGMVLGAHALGFAKVRDKCTVVAVAKAHPEKAEEIHKFFGGDIRIEKDYRRILAMEDIDAVDILLPHDMHMPATIEAAKAGKHVLVEKVMARNIYECDRMIESCEKAGVTLTVCHDRRYHPNWMAFKKILDANLLGEIYSWKLEHNQYLVFPKDHWARSYDCLGGGAIMGCLTHQIDGLRWFGGEVDSVTCMGKVIPERMEGEFIGAILAKMKSGALAELSINWTTKSEMEIRGEFEHAVGQKGEIYRQHSKGTCLKLYEKNIRENEFIDENTRSKSGFARVKTGRWNGHESGHERCIAEWVKLLRGEDACITTSGRDVRGTVEVAEAAYLSERTGKVIHLPIEAKPWGG